MARLAVTSSYTLMTFIIVQSRDPTITTEIIGLYGIHSLWISPFWKTATHNTSMEASMKERITIIPYILNLTIVTFANSTVLLTERVLPFLCQSFRTMLIQDGTSLKMRMSMSPSTWDSASGGLRATSGQNDPMKWVPALLGERQKRRRSTMTRLTFL